MKTVKTNAEKDLALVEAMKLGEKREARKALETLYKKYHDLILFRYKTMGSDEVEAEDLAMEAFEKCYENIAKFNENSGAFSTWLFSLTKNLFIDNFRKRKLETVSVVELGCIQDEEGYMVEKDFEADVLNPEEAMIKEERIARLIALIENTFSDKPHLKELIEMKYFSELSYEEMSNLLGCPLGTVKAHLFRAKNLLKEACIKENVTM